MTEATVQMLVEVEMIEWLSEVGQEEMAVNGEYETEDGLADISEFGGEKPLRLPTHCRD